ncbi:hypothetical protein HDU77_007508 [Chytriomyces hyalinus]|nr:hypothetical protein HDU77_007508 [Chytriomyces hyalinus]
MPEGSCDSTGSEGVDNLENDSSLLGMPTVAQLADLEAAILLRKAILWPTIGALADFELPQESQVNGIAATLPVPLIPGPPIAPLVAPMQSPQVHLSDEMLEHFNDWFDANSGFNAKVGVRGGVGDGAGAANVDAIRTVNCDTVDALFQEYGRNLQQVSAPEFQDPDIQADTLEEPKFSADELNIADKHMPAFNAFLDDYFANVHK